MAIFDDRVEVWSAGELPVGIKMKDLFKKHKSVLRNSTIAEVLFLAGYVERWGSGIDKMNNLMKKQGLSIPKYEEVSGNFVVIFRRKKSIGKIKHKTKIVPSLSPVCPQRYCC